MQLINSLLTAVAAASIPSLVNAVSAPSYDGYSQVWAEEFKGKSGSRVNTDRWSYITVMDVNNELQQYTEEGRNVQLSGGQTLQLVPWKDGNGKWTSGRIETKKAFKPQPNSIMIGEAKFRFGTNEAGSKQGLWPAFWMLGEAVRHGTEWPECGEIDIFEGINANGLGHGTVHCDLESGGACNEPMGISANVNMNDHDWHTWKIEWNRKTSSWREETITWYKDNHQFHQISGAQIGDEKVWGTLAHAPYYFIMNVAVGGDLPGDPDESTKGGYGSMMEVAYVAVYEKK